MPTVLHYDNLYSTGFVSYSRRYCGRFLESLLKGHQEEYKKVADNHLVSGDQTVCPIKKNRNSVPTWPSVGLATESKLAKIEEKIKHRKADSDASESTDAQKYKSMHITETEENSATITSEICVLSASQVSKRSAEPPNTKNVNHATSQASLRPVISGKSQKRPRVNERAASQASLRTEEPTIGSKSSSENRFPRSWAGQQKVEVKTV